MCGLTFFGGRANIAAYDTVNAQRNTTNLFLVARFFGLPARVFLKKYPRPPKSQAAFLIDFTSVYSFYQSPPESCQALERFV